MVTFDQPLWWKALTIISCECDDSGLKSIVLRLGAFHMKMSFLSSIAYLMHDSGLKETLETIYAPNVVANMLSGKAVARAVRRHFIVDSALNALVLLKAFVLKNLEPDQFPAVILSDNAVQENFQCVEQGQEKITNNENESLDTTNDQTIISVDSNTTSTCYQENSLEDSVATSAIAEDFSVHLLKEGINIYDKRMDGKIKPEDVHDNDVIDCIAKRLDGISKSMKASRTSTLWLQYMKMLDILRQFIKAERTGNWQLHLKSTYEILPYFVASGHNLYAKSGYIYLQSICKLEQTNPEVYEAFMRGHHVSRRSDRFWAGLSTDLVTEQVLMRSFKTTGGLTRGREMGETQRASWLLSMHACAEVNAAMQDFTQINYETSEQHEEMSTVRLKWDEKDSKAVLQYLQDRNPFTDDTSLRNISTGVVAQASASAERAEEIGKSILFSMENKTAVEYTFRKKDRVASIEKNSTVTIDSESVPVDPQLLFQHLFTAAGDLCDNPAEIFKYELCNFPSALFESTSMVRAANKAALAGAVWALGECHTTNNTLLNTEIYVLDGDSLLQRLPWRPRATFNGLCQLYTDYVTKNYSNSVFVFDGYETGPSTKDNMHLRRLRGKIGAEVHFKEDMICN